MKKKDLLDKWLNDELTPEEFEVIRTIPEYSSYLKIDTFVKSIELPEIKVEAGLASVKKHLSEQTVSPKPKVISIGILSKIAALLILMIASYYFISNIPTTTTTDLAEKKEIVLPDASKVMLNGNSHLSYKKFNWDTARYLSLEGEAFFEVKNGATFLVQTEVAAISVLGTKFNVVSRADHFAVSCYEGMVRIVQGEVAIDLTAGRTATIINGEVNLENTFISRPVWIYNESSFDDIGLQDVFNELEKHYNVQLSTENIDVNLRFSGSFPNDDLESALKAVTLPFKLNHRIENKDAVTIFGEINSK